VRVQPEFFETAAQLIPLLLLAAAVDSRGWGSPTPHTHATAISEVFALMCLTVSWLLSLIAVAMDLRAGWIFSIVFMGLAIGWTEVMSSIAFHQMLRVKHARITRRLRMWAVLSALSPLLVAAVLGLAAVR
jgi:hypothetical protein